MVIGVNLLGAELATKNLNGAVGDDLVGVHVRLSAGASLPDDKREVIVKLSGDDLVTSLDHGGSDGRLKSEVQVGFSSTLLENTEGLDDGKRHALAFAANLKVHKGSLSLSAPVAISWHLEGAEGIGLFSKLSRGK